MNRIGQIIDAIYFVLDLQTGNCSIKYANALNIEKSDLLRVNDLLYVIID